MNGVAWSVKDQPNPFGMSRHPTYVGGRFEQRQGLYDWIRADHRMPAIMVGVRGSGKTTLAHWAMDQLNGSVPVLYARGDLRRSILEQASDPTERSTTAELSTGPRWLNTSVSERHTDRSPKNLLDALQPETYIVVDEAQKLPTDDLADLAYYLETPTDHHHGQVLLVGTPELSDRFADADGTFGVFARGPHLHLSASQPDDEIRDMIEGTIADSDIRFSDAAITRVAEITDGYPPAVQVLCERAALTTNQIGAEDIDASIPSMYAKLRPLFHQMLNRQGNAGRPPAIRQAALRVIADHPATSASIASALGKQRGSDLNRVRNDLIRHGLITIDDASRWHLAVKVMRAHLESNHVGLNPAAIHQRSTRPENRRGH